MLNKYKAPWSYKDSLFSTQLMGLTHILKSIYNVILNNRVVSQNNINNINSAPGVPHRASTYWPASIDPLTPETLERFYRTLTDDNVNVHDITYYLRQRGPRREDTHRN